MLSCMVTTNSTLWVPPPIDTFAIYSGWAYAVPSSVHDQRLPKLPPETVAGVSAYSCRFWPVRATSLCQVVIPVRFVTATGTLRVLLGVPALVAVTVWVPALEGGVYSPPLLIVPTVLLPPATPSTLHFTVVPAGALVENCCV